MALWKRPRNGARPLSPALEAFVGCLAATPYEWYLKPAGKLRTNESGTEMCALTAVARYRLGRTYSVGDWIHAAESIGLSCAEAALVVDAADARPGSAAVRRLRARLLMATARRPARRAVRALRTAPLNRPVRLAA